MQMAAGSLAGLRILVVEDDGIIAMDLAGQLMTQGAEVMGPLRCVSEAVRMLEDSIVDAAVVDFVLEDQNSVALQAALEGKGVPFIVITGYPAVLVRRHARQTVLQKPLKRGELCATVEQICREGNVIPPREELPAVAPHNLG